MSEPNTIHETDDMYLAAYYFISGCEYMGRRKVGSKVIFAFNSPLRPMSELTMDYYSGKAKVCAYDFAQRVTAVKKMIQS